MLYTHYSYQYLLIIHTHTHKVHQHSLDLKHDVRAWFKKKKQKTEAWQNTDVYCLPVFLWMCLFPASLKATTALKKARRTDHRKIATGSIPIIPEINAFLLLLRRATMSGRIWSVFFSRKSYMKKIPVLFSKKCIKPRRKWVTYLNSGWIRV